MFTILRIESGFKVPNSDDLAFGLHYLCIRKFFEMNAMTPYNGANFNTKRINTRQKKPKDIMINLKDESGKIDRQRDK